MVRPTRRSHGLAGVAALVGWITLSIVALAMPAAAQAPQTAFPSATTIAALARYPTFYHLKAIVVRGDLSITDGQARLVPPGGVERGVELLLRGGLPSAGPVEVRGQFWDIGRLSPSDPHATAYDLPTFVRTRLGERWPGYGELLVVNASSVVAAPPASPQPSLRQLALDPERYQGQTLRVKGQFAGRNILGDLPQAPRVSRTDFVIRHAGGAVWVSGLPPKGRGWKLNPESRMDTTQWLEVEGVARHGEGLVWIEAKTLAQTKPDETPADTAPAPPVLPAAPPQVVFTLPAEEETDVAPTTTVRIQTSRDLAPETLEAHIRVTYLGQEAGATPIAFKAAFHRTNQVLELRFDSPLERFRTVRVDLLEGITGTDGQPLKPFTLTFSVGG